MVEFITQHDDSPSVLRDLYRSEQTGVHHVAHSVPDLAAAIAAFGLGFCALGLWLRGNLARLRP